MAAALKLQGLIKQLEATIQTLLQNERTLESQLDRARADLKDTQERLEQVEAMKFDAIMDKLCCDCGRYQPVSE